MAWHYVQSDLNALVLTIEGSRENGKLILRPKTGESDQLWKIDSDGKLVSKLGYVATIRDASTSACAEVIATTENGGIHQKWR